MPVEADPAAEQHDEPQGREPPRSQPLSVLYGDESGNTGTRLLPSDQPIFVFAFIELEPTQEQELREHVEAVRGQIELQDSEEFKFKRMVRGAEGLLAIRKLAEALEYVHAPIHFSIVEKRFYASALVGETLFDTVYNPYAPPEELFPGIRRWLTNKIHETCDDGILAAFTQFALGGDFQGVVDTGRTIVQRMSLHPDDRVADAARIMKKGLETAFDWGRRPDGPPRPTPLFSSFAPLLSAINNRLEGLGRQAEIIGDMDMQFGPTLDEIVSRCRDPGIFPGGRSAYGVEGPFLNILRRRQVTSESCMGVQLADIAAGMICRVALRTLDGKASSEEFLEAWSAVKRVATGHCSYWQVAEEHLKKMLTPFKGVAPPLDAY